MTEERYLDMIRNYPEVITMHNELMNAHDDVQTALSKSISILVMFKDEELLNAIINCSAGREFRDTLLKELPGISEKLTMANYSFNKILQFK